jgi:hypothetical protein
VRYNKLPDIFTRYNSTKWIGTVRWHNFSDREQFEP